MATCQNPLSGTLLQKSYAPAMRHSPGRTPRKQSKEKQGKARKSKERNKLAINKQKANKKRAQGRPNPKKAQGPKQDLNSYAPAMRRRAFWLTMFFNKKPFERKNTSVLFRCLLAEQKVRFVPDYEPDFFLLKAKLLLYVLGYLFDLVLR